MSWDPHEIRMIAGQAAIAQGATIDDELLALLETAIEALQAVMQNLTDKDLPRQGVASFVTGAVVALILNLPEDQHE